MSTRVRHRFDELSTTFLQHFDKIPQTFRHDFDKMLTRFSPRFRTMKSFKKSFTQRSLLVGWDIIFKLPWFPWAMGIMIPMAHGNHGSLKMMSHPTNNDRWVKDFLKDFIVRNRGENLVSILSKSCLNVCGILSKCCRNVVESSSKRCRTRVDMLSMNCLSVVETA